MWYDNYIHIPFVERGRDESGVDCWGLLRLIYKKELGIELPDYLDFYKSTNDYDTLSGLIGARAGWVDIKNPKEFDAIILNVRGLPIHVGVVTGKSTMIHSSEGVNTCHDNFKQSRWKHKVIGFARYESLC